MSKVRLRDRYDGSNDPFEGDRTVVWRSLPANALVTKATLTLEPVLPPGANTYTEKLRFGPKGAALGATIQQADTNIVSVDFHARRTATGIAGLTGITAQSLGVDLGGGVFLAVAKDGTVPAPQGSVFDFSAGVLPQISAQRLRLANATLPANQSLVTIDIASMPSNVTLRFGKLPPFWSKTGELGAATTMPDIAIAIQRAISDATVTNGFYTIPLIVHSDTVGRLAITLDIEYLGTAPMVVPGLREVVLPYDYASVSTTDPSALQATLPAGAAPVSPQTALQIRGAFDASRVAFGSTGATVESTPIRCSASETLAQPVIPAADMNISSVDLFVAADGPAARLALDLHEDFSGKPAQTSLLAKAMPFDLKGDAAQQRRWTNVPLGTSVQLKGSSRYWAVVEALDGKAFLGVDAAAAPDRLMQRSTDSGFSWRAAGLNSPLLLRLRTQPGRFQMPIDFVAGTGAQAQRVSLAAYDALGKIDAVIDRPEIAAAVQSYVTQTASAPCATEERLLNGDFTLWTAQGTTLQARSPIVTDGDQSLGLFDTFFDTLAATLSSGDGPPQALAYSPDGATLYAAVEGGISTVDTATLAVKQLVPRLATVGMAADPRGRALYVVDGSKVIALDLTTGQTTVLFNLHGAAALVVSPDGRRAYAAGDSQLAGYDLQTGTERFRIAVGAPQPALALTPDGATLVAINQTSELVIALDAATGSQKWAASLPPPSASSTQVVPLGVAIAADGATVYAVGGPQEGMTPSGAVAAALPSAVLYAFDANGRLVPPSITLPVAAGAAAIAVKPQGDRVYVARTALAMAPSGERLAVSGGGITVAPIAVGDRRPANWTLTAGQISAEQSADDPSRIEARLTNGSLSQVVAVASGCSHDLTVASIVEADSDAGSAANAVAEIYWLNATGARLRGDSLTLPQSAVVVTQRSRLVPPEGSAQAEVRVRVAGGDCVLRTVSLKSTDTLLQDDAWQPDPSTTSLLPITHDAGGTTYRNVGTGDGSVIQSAALAVTGSYLLDFSGRVIGGAANALPGITVRFQDATGAAIGAAQQIALDPFAFAAQPAQLSVPPSSAIATIRIVLPAGSGLSVERLALTSQPTVNVPCSFIAQSPGELHVSNARIAYDLLASASPRPPAGGLSPPTPPNATPGNLTQTCACADKAGVIGQPAPGLPLPAPASPARAAPAARATRAIEPPLMTIKGIGPVRQRRLHAAGISTIRDLAVAAPETVAHALSGPGTTVELGRELIEAAKSALAAQDDGR
jgi:predicted flap endonuclease-1-like 5' DNA nuclease